MPGVTLPFQSVALVDTDGGPVPDFGNATDTVWGSLPLDCTPAIGTKLGLTGSIVNVTCTATDGSGNTATEIYPIMIVRPPSKLALTVPSNQTLSAVDAAGAPFAGDIGATDNLTNPRLTIRCVDPAPEPDLVLLGPSPASASPASAHFSRTFAIGTTVVVCTVTNGVGTTATATFQVTVADTVKPGVTGADYTQEATGPTTTLDNWRVLTSLTATDDVTPAANLVITCTGVPAGNAFPVGRTEITCTAVDGAGNRSDPKTVAVIIQDTTPPGCPGLDIARTYAVRPLTGYTVPATVTPQCNDLVSGPNVTCTCTPTLPANLAVTEPPTTYTVSCVCRDQAGNPTTVTANTTITDDSAPIVNPIISGSNLVVEAQNPLGATVEFTVVGRTETNRPLPVTVTCDDTPEPFSATEAPTATGSVFSGAFGPVSSRANPVLINCTASATNPANNKTTTAAFTITVLDRVGPRVTQLPDITVQAPTEGPAVVVLPTPSARDEPSATPVDPNPTVVCVPAVGRQEFAFRETPYTVTCAATDSYGNTGPSMTFTVTTTKGEVPDLQCPADIRAPISACQNFANVNYTVLVVNGSAPNCTTASPVRVEAGKPVNVVCTSSNRFGNDKCNFTITAVDSVPPVVDTPCDIHEEGCVLGGIYLTDKDLKCTAKDNIDGDVPVTRTWPESAGVKFEADKRRYLFPVGTTVVTCSANDSSGNVASKPFNVVVTDTQAPHINRNVRTSYCAATTDGAAIEFAPSAYDIVSGKVDVMVSINNGTAFKAPATRTLPLGRSTITYTATDAVGNTRRPRAVHVTVSDCQAPVVRAPRPSDGGKYFIYDATNSRGVQISSLPRCTATDNISPVSYLNSQMSYSPRHRHFGPGEHTIVCSTRDQAGNTGSASYTIFVRSVVQHCEDAYRQSWRLHASCGVQRVLKNFYQSVQRRRPQAEVCGYQRVAERHFALSWVVTLGRTSPVAWSSCRSSFNKAVMLTGCGRSSSRKMA